MTHEVAAVVTLLAVIIVSEKKDDWITVSTIILFSYFIGYSINWRFNFVKAIRVATDGGNNVSCLHHFLNQKVNLIIAVLVSYKLYWIVIIRNLRTSNIQQKLLTFIIIASIGICAIASDASRLIQFGTLSMFLVVTYQLQFLSINKRKILAYINIIVPSFYIATNCNPLWGPKGLYSLYTKLGQALGYNW